MKVSGSTSIFCLVLYVDDNLLANNDLSLLKETKKFISSNFEKNVLSEASYVIGIQIFYDKSQELLEFSSS